MHGFHVFVLILLLLQLTESDSKTDVRKGGKKDSKGKPDKPSTGKKSEKKVNNSSKILQ